MFQPGTLRRSFRLIPDQPKLQLIRLRSTSLMFSALLVVVSIGTAAVLGLNFGIDFRGGILMEVRGPDVVDIPSLRRDFDTLDVGEVTLQEFGAATDVLIRVQRPPGAESEQNALIARIQEMLGDSYEYRRTEFVGPTVGAELIEAGTLAVIFALAGILLYVWLRFEWRFGLCAVIALFHDVIATIGLFAVIQHEFNLATVAALLTIAGYSINDTVVLFDRVRENLRKYKRTPVAEILNRSINETLARTVVTSFTTLLALIALMTFGGPIIRDFCFALAWGVVIGTYSSIFLAVPLLLAMKVRAGSGTDQEPAAGNQPVAGRGT